MAILRGPALGQLDPTVLALRDGYVEYHDRLAEQWPSRRSGTLWVEERALWLDGESMICRTDEIFHAAFTAGVDVRPFTLAHDRDNARLWQLPGAEGGPLVEVEVRDGSVVEVGPPDDPRSERQTRTQIARSGGNARWTNSHG